jgi:HEAT repeat protein
MRGRTIALLTLVLGLVVLVVAGIMSKDWIVEEWWLHKLRTGTEAESASAAKALGSMNSVKALRHLLKAYSQREDLHPVLVAGRIAKNKGAESVSQLATALKDADSSIRWAAAMLLGLMGPEAKVSRPDLLKATSDTSLDVRDAAAEALANVERGQDFKDDVLYPDGNPTAEEALLIRMAKNAVLKKYGRISEARYRVVSKNDGWSILVQSVSYDQSGKPRYTPGGHCIVALERSGKVKGIIPGR